MYMTRGEKLLGVFITVDHPVLCSDDKVITLEDFQDFGCLLSVLLNAVILKAFPLTETTSYPRRQNVNTSMVGLKNGDMRKHLAKNGEPQRSS